MSETEKRHNDELTGYPGDGETIVFNRDEPVLDPVDDVEMQENFEYDQVNEIDFETDEEITHQRRSKYHVKMDRFLTNGIIIAAILLVVLICYVLFG